MLSKFCDKPAQKWQILTNKANFERGLIWTHDQQSASIDTMHLIVGKDSEEVSRALTGLLREQKDPIIHLYPENFTIDLFCQEVETPPFLSKSKSVVLHGVELLPEVGREAICRYLEKPSPWVSLYLLAEVLTPQSKIAKLVEKGEGKVLRFKEEKAWEKEKRLADWLVQEAKRDGVHLSLQTAMGLVQSSEAQMLRSELDKLICFAFQRKEITQQDIALISTPAPHQTIWQLGDALFACDVASALTSGKILMEGGMAIFPLLASLRSQCATGIGILEAAEVGQVSQKYPYLKGQMLEKKLKILKKYSKERLQKAMVLIFETEVKAKNSAIDPALLLEILTVKLTHLL